MIRIIVVNLLLIKMCFSITTLEDVVFVASEKPFFIQVFENSNQKGADQGVIGLWGSYPWKPARFSYEEADVYCNKIGMRLPTENEWYEAASNLGENSEFTLIGDKLYDDNNELMAYINGPQSIDTYDIEQLGIDSIGTVGMTGNRPEYVVSSDPADPIYCGGAYETTDIEKVKLANACKRLSLGDTRSGTARCVLDYDDSLEYELTFSSHVVGELKVYLDKLSASFTPHGSVDPYDENPSTAVLIPENKWSKADDDDPSLLEFLEADEWLESLMEGYDGPVVQPEEKPIWNPTLGNDKKQLSISEALRLSHLFSSKENHSCAISNNEVRCWGYNNKGQLDVPKLENPKIVVTGHCFSCAVDDSGLKCWGNSGILKNLPTKSNPISITAGEHHLCALDKNGVQCWGNTNGANVLPVPSLSNPSLIAATLNHTCAVDDNGTKCWGAKTDGDLPKALSASAAPPLSNPQMISVGKSHMCALDDKGVQCWGHNGVDQIDVPKLSNVRMIAVGGNHSCALDDTGMQCWGYSGFGQLDIPALNYPNAIFAAPNRSCAIDEEGLRCWGADNHDQLNIPRDVQF